MPLVFAGEAQHEISCAGLRVAIQPRRHARPDRNTPPGAGAAQRPARRSSLPGMHPSAPPRGRRRRPPPASDTSPPTGATGSRPAAAAIACTSRHCAANSAASGALGNQPSNHLPTRSRLAGVLPPIHIGGPPGPIRRRRQHAAAAPASARPSPPARRSTAHGTVAGPPSCARRACRTARQQAANSARMFGTSRAMPTPRMKRPSDTWSSVATWCASSTGLRSAGSSTAVPSSTRGTRPATPASNVSGSCRGRASSESPTQTEL